jgi:hypothetical protein
MGFIPEFDIELPSWLDWVRPLLQWPVGSETQWWGRASALRAAAVKAGELEPELAGARAHTAAVLVGESGQAVDRQYAQVFGGDASLPASVDALQALAEAAESLGDQIQATKIGNITLAVWAVGQLAWLAASALFTGGASEAEVPVVEAMTEAASREIAQQGAEEVAGSLLQSLARSTVGRLVGRTAVGVVVGAGMGVGQTLLSDGVLALEGHAEDAGTLFTQLEQAVMSMGLVGGATGVLTGQAVGALFDKVFGAELSRGMVVFKQALTGLTSAEAANVLATVAGGGQVGEATFAGGLIGLLEAGHQEGKPGVLDRITSGLGRLTHGGPESPDVASEADEALGPAASVVDRPGEPSGPASAASDAGGSANDGAPQAHSAAQLAAPSETAGAASDHATESAAHGLPAESDSGAQFSVVSTNGHATSHGDVAAGQQPRPSAAIPAADTGASGADQLAAHTEPAPSAQAPAASPAGAQAPSSLAAGASGDGSPAGLSSPPTDPRAGLADPAPAGGSGAEPPATPAARGMQTTAAESAVDGAYTGSQHAVVGQGSDTGEQRAAPASRLGRGVGGGSRPRQAAGRRAHPTPRPQHPPRGHPPRYKHRSTRPAAQARPQQHD